MAWVVFLFGVKPVGDVFLAGLSGCNKEVEVDNFGFFPAFDLQVLFILFNSFEDA